jgi:hypothetical protein
MPNLTTSQIQSALHGEELKLYNYALNIHENWERKWEDIERDLRLLESLAATRLALKAAEKLSEARRKKLEIIFNSCPRPHENSFSTPYIKFGVSGYNALAALVERGNSHAN